jgi:DNA-binding response OmpR family regulator
MTNRLARTRSGTDFVVQTTGSMVDSRVAAMRLLLVEDHPDSAELLAELLEFYGHQVRIAGTAADAIELARSEAFDAVVSDVGLPDRSGYDLMKELRDRYSLKGIAVTGSSGEDEEKRGREAGFCAQLVKPVGIQELISAIDGLATQPTASPGG